MGRRHELLVNLYEIYGQLKEIQSAIDKLDGAELKKSISESTDEALEAVMEQREMVIMMEE